MSNSCVYLVAISSILNSPTQGKKKTKGQSPPSVKSSTSIIIIIKKKNQTILLKNKGCKIRWKNVQ